MEAEKMPKEAKQEEMEPELIIEDDTVYEIDLECMKRKGHKFPIQ